MRVLDLIRDWLARAGPEYWNPDEDEDVLEWRSQRKQAETASIRLRVQLKHGLSGNLVEDAISGRAGLRTWKQ